MKNFARLVSVATATPPDPAGELERALSRVLEELGGGGLVELAANRRALHRAEEPLEAFREYMADFALEQARAPFGSELQANLDRHWKKL